MDSVWFCAPLSALTIAALVASRLVAQNPPVQATIVEIAGANVYLDVGSEQGLDANDTVQVARADDGSMLGKLVILQTTSTRAVATFAGRPFPVTRGVALSIALPGAAMEATGPTAAPAPPQPPAPRSGPPPSLHGRFSLDVDGNRTVTHWLSNTELRTTRTYSTPSASLQLDGRDLPGGFRFQTRLRTTYRYSSPDIVDPSQAVEVYQLSVARDFGSVLGVEAGRFYSRYERYGGYYDGALVRLGTEHLGIGAAAGFQPSRGDQSFTTDYPKYGVFAIWGAEGTAFRYMSSASFDRLLPRNGEPDETFAGWSQRLSVGAWRASTDVRVDRRASGGWLLSQLQLRTGVRLAAGLSLDARASRYESPGSVLSFLAFGGRRDEGGIGMTAFGRAGTVGVDLGVTRTADGPTSQNVAASFALARPVFLGAAINGSVALWRRTGASTLLASVGVTRYLGAVQTRAGYQLYRTTGFATTMTHAVDLSISFPLGPRVGGSTRLRFQRGTNLDAMAIYAGLWTSF